MTKYIRIGCCKLNTYDELELCKTCINVNPDCSLVTDKYQFIYIKER